jgi:dTDP-4-dehydrorhamnose reductase
VATARTEADITDREALGAFADAESVTHIINAAAYTAVDQAEKERELAYQINAKGPENLGRVAEERGIALLHISTDYVFDGKKRSPYAEGDLPKPVNFYGSSKLEGEKRLLDAMPLACIVRTSWIFGSGGKGYVASLIEAMKKEKSVRAAVDQHGRLTYSKDLAAALLELVSLRGIFHYASSGASSRFEIAKEIMSILKRRGEEIACREIVQAKAKEFKSAAKRPSYSVLETRKVEELLRIKPRSWQEALEEYFDEEK